MNYTYLLKCADGTLYCGWTNNPEKRLAAHNAGTASKYTAARRPVEMVYLEEKETKQEAMKREAAIKRARSAKQTAESDAYYKNNARPGSLASGSSVG